MALGNTMNILRRILHSRLFITWCITLVVIVICLSISLLLISHSKRTIIQDAPPKLPDIANPTDILPEPQQINLFLLETDGTELTSKKVELRLFLDTTERLQQIISALIKATPPSYRNPIPRGTSLNQVYIDNQKIAYMDFSHHLASGQIGGTTAEFLTISAILKTVFDAFPQEVLHVQILIEGKEQETLSGHINISQPLRF